MSLAIPITGWLSRLHQSYTAIERRPVIMLHPDVPRDHSYDQYMTNGLHVLWVNQQWSMNHFPRAQGRHRMPSGVPVYISS
jgi:hypothetical protein